jgi:hypothetical protein
MRSPWDLTVDQLRGVEWLLGEERTHGIMLVGNSQGTAECRTFNEGRFEPIRDAHWTMAKEHMIAPIPVYGVHGMRAYFREMMPETPEERLKYLMPPEPWDIDQLLEDLLIKKLSRVVYKPTRIMREDFRRREKETVINLGCFRFPRDQALPNVLHVHAGFDAASRRWFIEDGVSKD